VNFQPQCDLDPVPQPQVPRQPRTAQRVGGFQSADFFAQLLNLLAEYDSRFSISGKRAGAR